MSALPLQRRKFSVEEYLEIERKAKFKSEFLDGDIYAMAGASPKHNVITVNISSEISSQLKGTPYTTLASNQRIRAGKRLFAYADLTVVCGEFQFHDDQQQDVLTNPVIIVEVLSPSTANYDRTTKFDRYKQIETLRDYVLVSQDTPQIIHRSRDKNGNWVEQIEVGLDTSIALTSAAVTLALADVYDRIAFENTV